jgi:hypothetical protein
LIDALREFLSSMIMKVDRLRRRIVALLTVLAAPVLSFAWSLPAQAASVTPFVSISATDGIDSSSGEGTTHIKVILRKNIHKVVDVLAGIDGEPSYFGVTLHRDSSNSNVWQGTGSLGDDAGRHKITVGLIMERAWPESGFQATTWINLRHRTWVKADAGPEPVKKGRFVTVEARMGMTSANYFFSPHLDGHLAKFYFKPSGAKHWKYKGSTRAVWDGTFAGRFKQTGSGTWKVVLPSTETAISAIATDYVRAR